jgi:hypothetical protein
MPEDARAKLTLYIKLMERKASRPAGRLCAV